MQTVIQQLLDGVDLDRDSARGAMDQIMSGQATDGPDRGLPDRPALQG